MQRMTRLHEARTNYQKASLTLALLRRSQHLLPSWVPSGTRGRDFAIRYMEAKVKRALDVLWEAQGRRNGRSE